MKPSVKIKIADRRQKKVRKDASGRLKKLEQSEVGKRERKKEKRSQNDEGSVRREAHLAITISLNGNEKKSKD